jgi:hypothetical protein
LARALNAEDESRLIMSETSGETQYRTTTETQHVHDADAPAQVGSADAQADAAQAGASGYSSDNEDLNDVEAAQFDDSNAAGDVGLDSDGAPVGRADADEDARRAGA